MAGPVEPGAAPKPVWRAPLIAAAIVLAACALLFAIVYAALSSDASDEAHASASIVATTDAASALRS